MERMKKEKESGTLLGVGTAYLPVKEIKGEFYVKVSDFTKCMDGIRIEQEADRKHIEKLEEENKKLNIKVASLEGEIKGLNYTIDKLKEENQTLELWLDNKEKLNEEYRKQIDLWKMSREEKDENCYGLAKENEQLKLHIEAKDKAYMSLLTDYNYLQARIKRMEKKFLEYVENHKKLEDELDEVIMNR